MEYIFFITLSTIVTLFNVYNSNDSNNYELMDNVYNDTTVPYNQTFIQKEQEQPKEPLIGTNDSFSKDDTSNNIGDYIPNIVQNQLNDSKIYKHKQEVSFINNAFVPFFKGYGNIQVRDVQSVPSFLDKFTGCDDVAYRKKQEVQSFSTCKGSLVDSSGKYSGTTVFRRQSDDDRYRDTLKYTDQQLTKEHVGPGMNTDPSIPASDGFHSQYDYRDRDWWSYKLTTLPGEMGHGCFNPSEKSQKEYNSVLTHIKKPLKKVTKTSYEQSSSAPYTTENFINSTDSTINTHDDSIYTFGISTYTGATNKFNYRTGESTCLSKDIKQSEDSITPDMFGPKRSVFTKQPIIDDNNKTDTIKYKNKDLSTYFKSTGIGCYNNSGSSITPTPLTKETSPSLEYGLNTMTSGIGSHTPNVYENFQKDNIKGRNHVLSSYTGNPQKQGSLESNNTIITSINKPEPTLRETTSYSYTGNNQRSTINNYILPLKTNKNIEKESLLYDGSKTGIGAGSIVSSSRIQYDTDIKECRKPLVDHYEPNGLKQNLNIQNYYNDVNRIPFDKTISTNNNNKTITTNIYQNRDRMFSTVQSKPEHVSVSKKIVYNTSDRIQSAVNKIPPSKKTMGIITS